MDLGALMGKFGDLQRQMQEAQKKMADVTVTAEVGGGMVKVTASADRRIRKIEVEAELLNDREMLEDLLVAGTNKALELAEEAARKHLQEITQGMLPNIPGLDLRQFGL